MQKLEADRLFERALHGSYDDEEAWVAVSKLRMDGDEYIFARAADWCASEDALHRARGADILCQLRKPNTSKDSESYNAASRFMRNEAFRIISKMPSKETDNHALSSELTALGHLNFEISIPLITVYIEHPDNDVRFAVAFALSSFPNDPRAVEHLLKLADDSSDEVRDWAIFGLGTQSSSDSAKIRDTFVRHLSDPFEEVQHEAAAGLAKRKDPRAVATVIRLLENGWYYSHHEESLLSLLDLSEMPQGWGEVEFAQSLRERYMLGHRT